MTWRAAVGRHWRTPATWIVVLVLMKVLADALDAFTSLRLASPTPVLALGAVVGLTYGLLSVGLVLVFRSNGIINFAHGQVGAFAAAFFGLAVVQWHVPYWLALPLALTVGAGVSAVAETAVVRRLRRAPRLMSVVATLGVGQFLVVFGGLINSTVSAGAVYPAPPGLPSFTVGTLLVGPSYTGMLLLCPLAVLVISLLLRASRVGLAMRAAAANPLAARTAGIFAGRMSGLAWAIAGALSALAAILTQPTQGFTSGDAFGPSLLLRALAGAVIARMSSIPRALAAGILLGVFEQVLTWNYPQSGLIEVALFALIVVGLLTQKRHVGRDEDRSSWATLEGPRPLAANVAMHPRVRWLGRAALLLCCAGAVAVPFVASNADAARAIAVLSFATIGLSVVVLSGLAGELTLGQFAVGAVGAVVSFELSSRTGNFPLAVVCGGLAAGVVCVGLGVPALRAHGLMLTVTTLSFALVTPSFLLPRLLPTPVDPGRPVLPVLGPLESARGYYWFVLAVFVGALLLARNTRRSGFGRLLRAVRDNEANASAFTVRPAAVKLQGYLVAGFIAGVGGAAYGHSLSVLGAAAFPAKASIDVVVMTVIGGVTSLSGPLLGALLVVGLPAFVPLGSLGLAATYLGQLLIVLYLPGGLTSAATRVRDAVVERVVPSAASGDGVAGAGVPAPIATSQALPRRGLAVDARPDAPGQGAAATVLLEAADLHKSFGGIRAVDGASLVVREGETVGLIGPNGAGKTTTFEMLSGFVRADSGTVIFRGEDVTGLAAHERASRGLIRSFQEATLFPTLTVHECVKLALERVDPTSTPLSLAGWSAPERRKDQAAAHIEDLMGLGAFRDRQVRELSTGTRRITEIACLVALEPKFLLLDEPSSGIAQRETEALGALLREVKESLGVTLLVIEHDIPLVRGISDRIVAMTDGRVIAEGAPGDVLDNPAVADAYLGKDRRAVERSDALG